MRGLIALAFILFAPAAWAQCSFNNPTACGSPGVNNLAVGGTVTGGNLVSSSVTPTGATSSVALETLTGQQGVLIDAFHQAGDADDTASFTRAVAAGVPILCSAKTYHVHDFGTGTVTNFVLRGVKGCVIQRNAASNPSGTFFGINATNVVIDGVTFDSNRANVSANQWGVLMSACNQNVVVRNSVFKNNSGSLGSGLAIICTTGTTGGGSFSITDTEITGNAFNALYLASVSNGLVSHNYVHDNDAIGIFASSWLGATSTNLLTDVLIDGNKIFANGTIGVEVGGISPPYTFGTPAAVRSTVSNNLMRDNAKYSIMLQGDYLNAINNTVVQSSASVSIFGGIVVNSRFSNVLGNVVTLLNAPWGIDIGGSVQATAKNNVVTVNQGTALNAGGNQNSVFSGNHLMLSGTAAGIVCLSVEADGAGTPLPTVASGTVFQDNTIDFTSGSTSAMKFLDNAGGFSGTTAMVVKGNHFNGSGGAAAAQAITWYGAPGSIIIDKNDYNGSTVQFVDPLGNGDVIFDLVFLGGTVEGLSSTTDIRSIIPSTTETFGTGSVLWTTPTAGGSGYTAATVINYSGTGCTGIVGSPQIIGGVIIGVKMTNFGSGCSGTVTASASDTGGGTGATFSVGTLLQVPTASRLVYFSQSTHILKVTGGNIRINFPTPFQLATGVLIELQAMSSNFWAVMNYTLPSFAVGSLPACSATNSGAVVNVTGSATSKWQARCNGTNWLWPDGTIVS